MTNQKREFFDLTSPLTIDTYLTVKYGLKWVHYNITSIKRNGEPRTFGELYHFYTNKPDFKMAIGYVRSEDQDCWTGQMKYFYFDKRTMPYLVFGKLKNPLYLAKTLR